MLTKEVNLRVSAKSAVKELKKITQYSNLKHVDLNLLL